MPLRIWRSDHVVSLAAHPNDPGLTYEAPAKEFLTTPLAEHPNDPASSQA